MTASRGPFVVQVDAGLDLLLAGDEHELSLLGRTDIGVGLGSRSTMLTAEFDNSMGIAAPRDHVDDGRGDQIRRRVG